MEPKETEWMNEWIECIQFEMNQIKIELGKHDQKTATIVTTRKKNRIQSLNIELYFAINEGVSIFFNDSLYSMHIYLFQSAKS